MFFHAYRHTTRNTKLRSSMLKEKEHRHTWKRLKSSIGIQSNYEIRNRFLQKAPLFWNMHSRTSQLIFKIPGLSEGELQSKKLIFQTTWIFNENFSNLICISKNRKLEHIYANMFIRKRRQIFSNNAVLSDTVFQKKSWLVDKSVFLNDMFGLLGRAVFSKTSIEHALSKRILLRNGAFSKKRLSLGR